jgi:hypothetical protein
VDAVRRHSGSGRAVACGAGKRAVKSFPPSHSSSPQSLRPPPAARSDERNTDHHHHHYTVSIVHADCGVGVNSKVCVCVCVCVCGHVYLTCRPAMVVDGTHRYSTAVVGKG